MTNETKKRGIGKTLFIALVALTLISCCFLGSTFARYTSGGDGSATTGVAKWDVSFGDGSTEVEFTALSPSHTGWSEGAKDVANASERVLVATITNKGDVGAQVTIDIAATTITYNNSGTWETLSADAVKSGINAESDILDVVDIDFFYSTTSDTPGDATSSLTDGAQFTLAKTNGVLYIFAQATWTTAYGSSSTNGGNEDVKDTWIGKNVASIAADIEFTAVQGETISSTVSGD